MLAANTSYADFPRLSSFMARDRFMPRQLANQGDRLVFSNGIAILTLLAVLLLVVFHGETHALIPLYAVGVFISFTLSQSGMVVHWLRLREPGWRWRVWINGVGALVTGIVMLTIAATKFMQGAWIIVLVIPALVLGLLVVHRHYRHVAGELSLEGFEPLAITRHSVLVLVGDLHRGVVGALAYAQSLSAATKAIYIETDPERTRRLEERWGKWGQGVPLVVLTSPYRSLLRPPPQLHRSPADARRAPCGDHCPARVCPQAMVAEPPAQPDRLAGQGGPALSQGRHRHRRAVPLEALSDIGGERTALPPNAPHRVEFDYGAGHARARTR